MSFDKSIAIEAAELIHALYRGGIAPTINERSTDTQALILRRGANTFVVFPGTDSIADWRTDLEAGKRDWIMGGRAHVGFCRALESVMDEVVFAMAGSSRVIVCGHSLGGALAMLCASSLWYEGIVVDAVYTFGQPRVGNGGFARGYNANLHDETFRIVNQHDPVPYLPPWLMGYRHAGTEVFLGADGITVDRPWWDQGRDALQQMRVSQPEKNFVSVGAHHITAYIKKLKG